jgi:hypothetical protein
MIPTVLAHAHAAAHIHPETLAVAGACFALSLVAWRILTGIRRRKAR